VGVEEGKGSVSCLPTEVTGCESIVCNEGDDVVISDAVETDADAGNDKPVRGGSGGKDTSNSAGESMAAEWLPFNKGPLLPFNKGTAEMPGLGSKDPGDLETRLEAIEARKSSGKIKKTQFALSK